MARRGGSAGWSLGHHRTSGRAGSDGRLSRGNDDGGRSLASRWDHGFALRTGWRRGRTRRSHGRSGGWGRWLGSSRRCRLARGRTASFCLFFLFLLLGQNGLQHVAGLGDMREIDFGRDGLRGARRTGRSQSWRAAIRAQNAREPSLPRNPPANWSGSCRWPGRVPPRMSRICARLLTSNSRARSLIRTLLIRLFSKCATQSPLVVRSADYLMAMAALNSLVARLAFKRAAHLMRRPLWPPARPMLRFRFRPIPSPASPHPLPRERSQRPTPPR